MIIDKKLIEHCSPTLSGLKPASLFTVKTMDKDDMRFCIDYWNKKFEIKGMKLVALKHSTDFSLFYLYRVSHFETCFNDRISSKIMKKCGYIENSFEQKLERLKKRLKSYDEFPHEIGLFLGYPPKDVDGFICNKGQNCNLCGYWKVYGDTTDAIKKFAQYDKCRDMYKKLWEDGNDIMRLVVA